MPNLKKTYYQFVAAVTRRPEWYVPLKTNKTGYRSYEEAASDFRTTFTIMEHDRGFMYHDISPSRQSEALSIYGRSGQPKNQFLIIGRKGMTTSTVENPGIDSSFYTGFGTINEVEGRNGSVLDAYNWTFYVNDMFMIGGIANKRPFYLASNRTSRNLYNREGGHLTIFGRELAGLFMAGYEVHQLSDGSEIMIPPGGLNPLTIQRFNENLFQFSGGRILTAMRHPDLIRIDYIPESANFRPIIADL